jgi:hypothetical protein
MAGPLEAKVILAKCPQSHKPFGIRIEKRGGDWVRTWAFAIDERKAKHEGFDASVVTGSLDADDDYPGCPYCGSGGFDKCSCGKLFCPCNDRQEGDVTIATCPWCGETAEYSQSDSFEVRGGNY